MNELDFQGHLVDAAVTAGAHAFKCNNRFLVGVSDLSVKLPKRPHIYIECKKHNTLKGIQNTGLTPHQKKFLKDYRDAGGVSGWVTFAPIKGMRDAYDIFISIDIADKVNFNASPEGVHTCRRLRGQDWPIEWIVDKIIKNSGFREPSYS